MIASLRHFLRWMVGAFRSREDLVLENLALRRQLLENPPTSSSTDTVTLADSLSSCAGEHGAQGMRQWTHGALGRTLMAKKLAYEDRKIAFEKQVKLAIAKEFSAGNKALPLDGGFPPDYGFLSEEDMAEILKKAAAGIDGTTDCAGDYLFHREPYLD